MIAALAGRGFRARRRGRDRRDRVRPRSGRNWRTRARRARTIARVLLPRGGVHASWGVWCVRDLSPPALIAPAASAQVLRVGTYNGIPGQYTTIQAAVNAAQPGDRILVGPGDYKTTGVERPERTRRHAAPPSSSPRPTSRCAAWTATGVIVDGTKPGIAPCSASAADQNLGAATRRPPRAATGSRSGRRRHLGREPHRLQLPGRRRAAAATRSGGTAATAAGRSAARVQRRATCRATTTTSRRHRRGVRDLRRATGAARHAGPRPTRAT